jgi:peroxiredoxin
MRTLVLIALFAASAFAQASSGAQPGSQLSFAALTMDGATVDTAELRGKVVAVNLWFINCPNCVQEIKLLNQLVDEYKGNTDVAFVSLAMSGKLDLEKFLKKHPFKYQVVPDAGMIVMSKFAVFDKKGEMQMPFPMHYVIDREGRVVVKVPGIKGVDVVKAELKKQLTTTPAK